MRKQQIVFYCPHFFVPLQHEKDKWITAGIVVSVLLCLRKRRHAYPRGTATAEDSADGHRLLELGTARLHRGLRPSRRTHSRKLDAN